MADYRKFWLINSLRAKYDLTEQNFKVFLNAPEGLGFQRRYETEQVGNTEIITSQQIQMTDVTGEIIFYGEDNAHRYQDYQKFIQFCKHTPLEFHYLTPNSFTGYYCDIIFTRLDKGEVSKDDSMLRTKFTFHRLTEWLTDESKIIIMDNNPVGDGKYHDLEYDYSYAGTNLSNTTIYNTGTEDVGFIIEIDGEVQNPYFTLTQNGTVYGRCKINGTYDFVQINSVEGSESMVLQHTGSQEITNPEQYQDFTIGDGKAYLTWCKLKVGETKFNFTAANINSFDGLVKFSFRESFISV